jgi:hypothetical protein
LAKNPDDRFASAEALVTALAAPGVTAVGDVVDLSRASTELAVAATLATDRGSQPGARSLTEVDRAGRAETMVATDPELEAARVPTGSSAAGKGRIAVRDDATIPDLPPAVTVERTVSEERCGGKRVLVIVTTLAVVIGGVVLALTLPREDAPRSTDTGAKGIATPIVPDARGTTDPGEKVDEVVIAPPDTAAAEALLKALAIAAKNRDFETALALHDQLVASTSDTELRARGDAVIEQVRKGAATTAERLIGRALAKGDCKRAEVTLKVAGDKLAAETAKRLGEELEACKQRAAKEADAKTREEEAFQRDARIREAVGQGMWVKAIVECQQGPMRPNILPLCLEAACRGKSKGVYQMFLGQVPAHEREAKARLCPELADDFLQRMRPNVPNAPNAPNLPPPTKAGD